jgi:hypothetical protein
MSIVFGYQPVSLSFDYILASTLLLTSILSVQFYVKDIQDLRSMWCVHIRALWVTITYHWSNCPALSLEI